ncbi:E3 ubiquitin-protein ligase ring1-like protein [Quillaja saponaria]|uniref:RING-type E3 ubiquitin transferase n=1 Tax=Quillaja saponaria TaxID=32244 RepID=A0AAD7PSK8_QUISA|nr:E3 ubiquitin-protein ligase ring1-like protein [Quillaja saponaria]
MSLSPPRVRTNGQPMTYQLYWCYRCHRTVRVASTNPSDIVCPRCFGQFLCEINISRPRLVVDYSDYDPSPEARLLEALSLMLDPPIRLFNHGNFYDPETEPRRFPGFQRQPHEQEGRDHSDPETEIPVRHFGRRRSRNFNARVDDNPDPEPEIQARPRTWIIIRPIDPSNPVAPIFQQPENLPLPPGVDRGNYFFGPGLNELIEQWAENDRPGPPPASDRAINTIPSVKIREAHLKDDYHCPVCKEEFEVGGQAKELPCNHIYHSECIIPWLRLHNSCPVCRQELAVSSVNGGEPEDSDESSNGGGGGRRRRRCLRWSQLASLWPFRGGYRRINPQGDNVGTSPNGKKSASDIA